MHSRLPPPPEMAKSWKSSIFLDYRPKYDRADLKLLLYFISGDELRLGIVGKTLGTTLKILIFNQI